MLHKLHHGVARAQGARDHQEDRYTCVDNLSNGEGPAYFAVFDGHGGDTFATHSSANVHKLIFESKSFEDGDYTEAIREGLLEEDKKLFKEHKKERGGCTATVCLITNDKLYLGNVGDSRAVVVIEEDDTLKAIRLSRDWKPDDPDEKKRIIEAGGVVARGRVCTEENSINMSRAMGDFNHKMPLNKADGDWIASEPYLADPVELNPNVRFLILASDGVWNVTTDKQAVAVVNKLHEEGKKPSEIAANLTTMCADAIGSDNVTVIIVIFDYEQHKSIKSHHHTEHHQTHHHQTHHHQTHHHHHKQSEY